MENYTKYKLKSSDELASVLNGKDNLFVIACNKCFKEFETVEEPDCDEFLKFAKEQGKTVTGSAKVDFLCNKMHTERKLQDLLPEGTENVVVISCGLGIQTVADLAGKPVVAASNTLNYRGHHGMALTKKSCDACAQCYLNITGGVCPIVDCSKSLVNGSSLRHIRIHQVRNWITSSFLLLYGELPDETGSHTVSSPHSRL